MGNRVTIAIASYNNAPYIERCVDSVINQTYMNLEILIIDDGSTDDSVERIARFNNDERVRVIVKENGGLSSVRQRALDEAVGDYICFIDADDYIAPDYVRVMYEKLREDKSDICVCSTRFEDVNGNCLLKETEVHTCKDSKGPINVSLTDISNPNEVFSSQFLLSDSWNKMYKVSFLRQSGVVFNMPKGLNGTDTVFNRQLLLRCPSYSTVSKTVNVHVIYKKSAVHRKGKDLHGTAIFITIQLLNDIKKLGIEGYMSKRVSIFYYQRFLGALADIYREYRGNAGLYIRFKTEYERYTCFRKESGLPPIRISEISSKEIKSFLLFLKYAKPMLPVYFKLHEFIFQ